MDLQAKLTILADAAKYDASCASSGSSRRDSRGTQGIGSTGGMGICHSYAPDGRCISLLKILLTNFCLYDCSYCINRISSPVRRARFSSQEVARLTLDFYKRNYIEGLFLSSGIIQSPDYTMEQLIDVARLLRAQHFRGYIHLKTIPEASPELLAEAGRYADRLSINVELPSETSLRKLAPEKSARSIQGSMAVLRSHIQEARESQKHRERNIRSAPAAKPRVAVKSYAPAGQSTQMIVGADQENDARILTASRALYDGFAMRRVYYSAFSPIPNAAEALPAKPPPLWREHRLYQADWLMRFYQFSLEEIIGPDERPDGMLDLELDPKLAWALRHRGFFPVDLNRASREALLRVPGIGTVGARRILQARRFQTLRAGDLRGLRISLRKAGPFIELPDHQPDDALLQSPDPRQRLLHGEVRQMSLL